MTIALVTGGAGFIGSHVVDQLLEQGTAVRVLDNLSTGSLRNLQAAADRQSTDGRPARDRTRPHLEVMIGDIRDERLVRKAMQHVDMVFHLAAQPAAAANPGVSAAMHMVNVRGTINVLDAATAEGVRRVVFASCASVYGRSPSLAVSEDGPTNPDTLFAASKLAGEVYCRAYQEAYRLETVSLRYFPIYGPRQSAMLDDALVPSLISALQRRARPAIPGDGRGARDLLFIEDAVRATVTAAHAPLASGQVINIGSGQVTSTLEVLDILNHLLRTNATPRLGRARVPDVVSCRAKTGRAQDILSCAPRVSLVTGLARCVEFFSESERHEDVPLAEVRPREERADF